jgi:hypothetical protein
MQALQEGLSSVYGLLPQITPDVQGLLGQVIIKRLFVSFTLSDALSHVYGPKSSTDGTVGTGGVVGVMTKPPKALQIHTVPFEHK